MQETSRGRYFGTVICLSWVPVLAETRKRLLIADGYAVVSLVGLQGINELEKIDDANLLILAHSLPRDPKRRALEIFRQRSRSPVLSLLLPHQFKLPEVDYGIEASSPREFLGAVKNILHP